MSNNFTGVTFANQKVTPSHDGTLRRALFTDGILTGCELGFSGPTLSMGPGQLIVCGRQIVHPSTQYWAVADATSGYARLLLTVDLSRTSTKDAFDQVVDSIEYSSSADGFPSLSQSDINTAGTVYQAVVCVVALGSSGITGIVSALGSAAGFVPTSGGTMTGHLHIDTSGYPTVYFEDENGNGCGSVFASTTNKRTYLRCYATDDSGFYENYRAPAANDGLTANKTYDILTTKTVTYGTKAPESAVGKAGIAGRIYFKKVT